MRAIYPLLAQLPDDFAPRKFSLTSGSKELVIVIGAVVLVSGMALIWALFIRKKPRRHHHHSHSHQPTSSNSANSTAKSEGSEGEAGEGSRRRRRRRRKERPRNPTLAETGGLPPVRGDEPREGPP